MYLIRALKNQLRKFLRKKGYEIRALNVKSIYSPRQSMEEALAHIKSVDFYPDLIIDVGVANGTPPLQNCFPKSFFYWIEPLTEFEKDIRGLKNIYSGDYCITAVGSSVGISEININEDLHGSSLLEQEEHCKEKINKRQISVTTINELSKKNNFKRFKRILLKLDVQGFELDVLAGASEIMDSVDVIIMEVGLFRHYKMAPDFYEIVVAMKKLGYVVYDIVEGLNRPYDFALSSKDLFFVKEKGMFRKTQQWNKD